MNSTIEQTAAEKINAEIDEAISAFRAAQTHLWTYPTANEYDAALRSISDGQQRIDYAVLEIRQEMKR